jgi:WD40-like Beta Propeller Repeat
MKRFGASLGVAVVSLFAALGCNDYGNTFQVPTGATLVSLSPATVPAGSATFTLTLNGTPREVFVNNTVVQWNGTTCPPSSSSNTSTAPCVTNLLLDANKNVTGVTAAINASLVAKQGTATVNTLSPHSGAGTNGLSNVLTFIINPAANPVPVVTAISPSCTIAPGSSFALTVNGSSFLPTSDPSGGSQVRWTAGSSTTTLAIVSISSSQIQATVPNTLVGSAGSAAVSVFNPPSPQTTPPGQVPNPSAGGGGSSANQPTFTILATGSTCPAGTTAKATTAATLRIAEQTPAVSVDGRYVAYVAEQDGHSQVFVRDTCQGAEPSCQARTLLLSTASDGTAANDDSGSPSISADGRYVAFSSAATNLSADAPKGRQIYVRDTCFGVQGSCTPSTQLVSKDESGALVGTESILPSISGSGRFVVFLAVTPSPSNNRGMTQSNEATIANATNSGYRQVFVRDTCVGVTNCTPKTTRISLHPGDTSNMDAKPAGPSVSGSGKNVAVPGAETATIFTHGVAVDDRVFLALTSNQ